MTETRIELAGTHRPYRPSNGTEGEFFMAEWCEQCALSDYDGYGCAIQLRSLSLSIDDPEYPVEWCLTNGGAPQCTAFSEELPPEPRCDKTFDMFADLLDGREHNDMPEVKG
jgi:hypothetical protein